MRRTQNVQCSIASAPRSLRRTGPVAHVVAVLAVFLSLLVPVVASNHAAAQPAVERAGVYAPLTPFRVLDTREGLGGSRVPDRGSLSVRVTGVGGVPRAATAVAVNLTITNTSREGFVTAWPKGAPQPLASVINAERAGQTIANLVTVPVGADGMISLYSQRRADLVLDVQGFYVPAQDITSGRFLPASPTRVVDTRESGGRLDAKEVRTVDLAGVAGVNRNTTAAVLKVTVDDATKPGFWSVYPDGAQRPNASNLNASSAGQTVANQVIVGLRSGRLSVFAQHGGHLIIDVVGSFTGLDAPPSNDGRFVPVGPSRLVDTRAAVKPGNSATIEVPVLNRAGLPGGGVAAVVVNATTTETSGIGYVALWSSRRYRPVASSLNATAVDQTIANHVVTPVTANGFAMFTQNGGHLLADITGYYTGPPQSSVLPPPVALPNPGAPPPSSDHRFSLVHQPGGGVRGESPTGSSVRWDPCRPIRYVVNYGGQRARYGPIVREALDRLSAATGLSFVSRGETAFMPTTAAVHDMSPIQGLDRSGDHELIVAFGNAAATDLIDGALIGRSNLAWVSPGGGIAEYVLSSIVVDTVDTAGAGDWAATGAGPVLLHELAHSVGLSHASAAQLMSPIAVPGGPNTYRDGDRAGLWKVGRFAGGCVGNRSLTGALVSVDVGWLDDVD